jgi:hypothetical protein
MSEDRLREAVAARMRRIVRDHGGVRRFASSVGCSRNAVYYWISGDRLPDAYSLTTLARLGIDVNYLLGGSQAV